MFRKLKYNSDKNKHSLIKANSVNTNAISDFYNKIQVYYDTDWSACELELFKEATSTTKDVLLPQKAKYDFSFTVNTSEYYLPFIHWNIIAKTVPEQDVRGVGEFTFTGLKEIVLSTYQWQGTTQITQALPDDGGWVTYPFSNPHVSKPTGTLTKPTPQSAYDDTVIYTKVYISSIGVGLGPYDCNADGTIIYDYPSPGSPELTTLAWSTLIKDTYGAGPHNTTWSFSESVDFIPDTWMYPPSNDSSIEWEFPNGTTDDPDRDSTVDYPNQYWENQSNLTFNQFMTSDGSTWGYPGGSTIEDKYDYIYDIFKEWYPGAKSIISDYPSVTYHAYRPTDNHVIKSGVQQVIINKINETTFRFDIKGYLLLLSKANVETDYSDTDNPTYQPNGEDLLLKLKVYYEQKLNTQVIRNYIK